VDRPSKVDQAPATIETARNAADMEVQVVVLRPRGVQARLVVADDDSAVYRPHHRPHVRVPSSNNNAKTFSSHSEANF